MRRRKKRNNKRNRGNFNKNNNSNRKTRNFFSNSSKNSNKIRRQQQQQQHHHHLLWSRNGGRVSSRACFECITSADWRRRFAILAGNSATTKTLLVFVRKFLFICMVFCVLFLIHLFSQPSTPRSHGVVCELFDEVYNQENKYVISQRRKILNVFSSVSLHTNHGAGTFRVARCFPRPIRYR